MKFHAEGRKVALITNNCLAHPNVDNLKVIELVFLPPSTTSKTQPMDQLAIRAMRVFYRTNLVRSQIPTINILEAMLILFRSWDAVF